MAGRVRRRNGRTAGLAWPSGGYDRSKQRETLRAEPRRASANRDAIPCSQYGRPPDPGRVARITRSGGLRPDQRQRSDAHGYRTEAAYCMSLRAGQPRALRPGVAKCRDFLRSRLA
jgi:hypothetical protein